MAKKLSQRDSERELFLSTRRRFLKYGAGIAGSVGLAAVINSTTAKAAADGLTGSATLDGRAAYGPLGVQAALGKAVPTTDRNLSTSTIVGPIERTHEFDNGWIRGMRGLVSEEVNREAAGPQPRFIYKYPLTGWLADMCNAIGPYVDGPVRPDKLRIPGPAEMTTHILEMCRFLRADCAGVGLLPPYSVYKTKAPIPVTPETTLSDCTPIELPHRYAITVGVDQDLKTFRGGTGYDGISGAQSMMPYFTSGCIAVNLAGYIRALGYEAKSHHGPLFHYDMAVPPVAIACGMGEQSRVDGSAMHPVFGLRTKLAVVTTNLPLEPQPVMRYGVMDFCRNCRKCADNCPAGAIGHEKDPVEHNGYLKFPFDVDKCTHFRYCNHDGAICGRCVKVCPWGNKEDVWYHYMSSWFAEKSKSASTLLRDIDDWFGFGTETRSDMKWWLEWPELY